MTAKAFSTLFLAGLMLLVFASSASAVSWANGSDLTIQYVPNEDLGVVYISTDVDYHAHPDDAVREVAGSRPPGVFFHHSGPCPDTGKLCTAFSGTPTASGTYTVTLRADDFGATADLVVLWQPKLVLNGTVAPAGIVGDAYSSVLSAVGGTAPYAYSIASGSLPPGLMVDAATGAIGGVPTTAGAWSFTAQVMDAATITATRSFTIAVASPLEITTTALPAATAGGMYAATVTASGGAAPVQWSAVGLPAGVSLKADTGALTGAFPAPGDIAMTVTATDGAGRTDSAVLTVAVSPELVILTDSIPTLERGKYAKVKFLRSGGLGSFAWSGEAPSGMRLRADGALIGTPTAAGVDSIFVGVRDANGHYVERSYDVAVEDPSGFRLSRDMLIFESAQGGPPPTPQQVTITSNLANQAFTIRPQDPWLVVSQASSTPAVIEVAVDIAGLPSGDYSSKIDIPEAGASIDVLLSVLDNANDSLSVAPSAILIEAEPGGAAQTRLALVRTTGEPGILRVEPDPSAPWLSVDSSAPAGAPEGAALLTITTDPHNLGEGFHFGLVAIKAGVLSFDLPVTVDVTANQFELSHTGLTFNALAGEANPPDQKLRVLSRETPPEHWTASADTPWLAVNPPAGMAAPSSDLDVSVDTAGLKPGLYSSAVTAHSSGGVARKAEVMLLLSDGPAPVEIAPSGLAFHSQTGETPPSQQIVLSYGGRSPLSFVHAIAPAEAASWLTVTPSAGSVPARGNLVLEVQPTGAALAPGVHEATLTLEFADGTIRVVRMAQVVSDSDCRPTRLTPVLTRLGDHFQAQALMPSPVEILVLDDCGNPVSEGAGLLELSEEDESAIPLRPGPSGVWTGTWPPATLHESIAATAVVRSADGLLGTARALGAVRE